MAWAPLSAACCWCGAFGVSSLAIGTVAGAFFGPFLLNWIFARRAGARYRPILDWHDEGLREWVRLSLPLMVGVSLVTADNWIIAHFASDTSGAVSLMSYAKQLFTAPMAMLAQAAGAASMPFFASLWSQQRRYEFATGVADSVSRVAALGLLAASGMVALGAAADRPGVYGRTFFSGRCAGVRRVFRGILGLAVSVVGAGYLCARVLCGAKHICSHGGGDDCDGGFAADLCGVLPLAGRDGAGHRFRCRHRTANRNHRRLAAQAAHGLAGQPGLTPKWAAACWLPLAAAL